MAAAQSVSKSVLLFLAVLPMAGCENPIYRFSATPAQIELGALYFRSDQELADAAQSHCQQSGRDAVEVRRQRQVMPNALGGRAILYHCR